MALSYKTRRRLSMLILIVGLPVYIMLAWFVMSLMPRQNILIELVIYVVLGVLWALPFKNIFKGVGQADPEAKGNSRR